MIVGESAGLQNLAEEVQILQPVPFAEVAQLVEHLPEEQGVTGSIPVLGTIFKIS